MYLVFTRLCTLYLLVYVPCIYSFMLLVFTVPCIYSFMYLVFTVHGIYSFMYLVFTRLCTLYLLARQVRVTVDNSDLCFCVCVTSFER